MTRAVFHIVIVGLTAVACASASYTPIIDLNQVPTSAYSGYALMVQGGTFGALHLTSDSPITGNVAIGSNSETVQSSGDTIHGNLDFAGPSSTQGTTGGVTVTGSTHYNVAAADNAVADAKSLFATYTGTSSIASLAAALSGSTLNVSGTGNYSAHEFVYYASTSLGAVTINAPSSDYVIINVGESSAGAAGTGNYQIANVSLTGGITIDHVLFDIDTTGNFQAGPSSPTVNADIIDNLGTTNLNSITLNGRIFCSDATATEGDCSIVSNAFVNQPAGGSVTPEPASVCLAAGGMLLLGFGAFRRRRAVAAQVQ